MLPADLGDRPVAAQPGEHDLELLGHSPRAVLLPLAQRDSFGRAAILRRAPEAISASALRASAPIAPGLELHFVVGRRFGDALVSNWVLW
jgi:hypothetical protein